MIIINMIINENIPIKLYKTNKNHANQMIRNKKYWIYKKHLILFWTHIFILLPSYLILAIYSKMI